MILYEMPKRRKRKHQTFISLKSFLIWFIACSCLTGLMIWFCSIKSPSSSPPYSLPSTEKTSKVFAPLLSDDRNS